jgi:microcystin degradation protein MlrC
VRVATGGFLHETSTFAVTPTTLEQFMRFAAEGDDLIKNFSGTKSAIGGYIDAARDFNFELVPTIFAATAPSGVVTGEALTVVTAKIVEGLKKALETAPLDGILLDLHGAMVSEIDDDAESYTLREIRKVVGNAVPIIVELDLHGNITPETVSLATVCVAYDEYPHVDPYERGYESGVILTKIVRGGAKPTPYIVNIPLLAEMPRQFTYAEPMLTLKRLAREIEHERGVLNVSYLPGFGFADIPHTNFAIIVTTDNDPAQAEKFAKDLAKYVWSHRQDFTTKYMPIDEAVKEAMSTPEAPVILADLGDNPGAGTPADGTAMLEALLRLGAKKAVVAPINDPAVAEIAHKAGIGATIEVTLGAKTDKLHGEPLNVAAKVLNLTDGKYIHTGPMGTGVQSNMGNSAVLEIAGQNSGAVKVLVTTYKHQPLDLNMLQSQGIEPTEQQIVVVKSLVHYRAAFTPIAKRIIEVDSPGISNPNFFRYEFKNLKRPIYPLDAAMEWQL